MSTKFRKYVSTEVVRAAEIVSISPNKAGDGYAIIVKDMAMSIQVSHEYTADNQPQIGGYLTVNGSNKFGYISADRLNRYFEGVDDE